MLWVDFSFYSIQAHNYEFPRSQRLEPLHSCRNGESSTHHSKESLLAVMRAARTSPSLSYCENTTASGANQTESNTYSSKRENFLRFSPAFVYTSKQALVSLKHYQRQMSELRFQFTVIIEDVYDSALFEPIPIAEMLMLYCKGLLCPVLSFNLLMVCLDYINDLSQMFLK